MLQYGSELRISFIWSICRLFLLLSQSISRRTEFRRSLQAVYFEHSIVNSGALICPGNLSIYPPFPFVKQAGGCLFAENTNTR